MSVKVGEMKEVDVARRAPKGEEMKEVCPVGGTVDPFILFFIALP
jgi:hypothetical protein